MHLKTYKSNFYDNFQNTNNFVPNYFIQFHKSEIFFILGLPRRRASAQNVSHTIPLLLIKPIIILAHWSMKIAFFFLKKTTKFAKVVSFSEEYFAKKGLVSLYKIHIVRTKTYVLFNIIYFI